jgi:hypothetical protein
MRESGYTPYKSVKQGIRRMAIIAALITASVTLLVPFIVFYLNRAGTQQSSGAGSGTVVQMPITISPGAKFFFVLPLAVVFSVPVGFLAFCVTVVINIFAAPSDQSIFLFSLDAGFCAGGMFGLSLLWHAGVDEPRKWWGRYQWYQAMMAGFFGSLGFTVALVGNAIWSWAHGIDPAANHVFHDSFDAAIASAVVSWLAGYATVKIEELRGSI